MLLTGEFSGAVLGSKEARLGMELVVPRERTAPAQSQAPDFWLPREGLWMVAMESQ